MVIEESNMRFEFPDDRTTVKFDEELFYRNSFNKFPESKRVDFITDGKDLIVFIEVKNCRGHEGDNRWRIAPNNQKWDAARVSYDVRQRRSLDIEVAQKVAEYGEEDIRRILETEGRIRSRRKIEVMIYNGRSFREVRL